MPSKLKQTAFRLNERDLAIIDDVKESADLTTRTEALRFLLRAWTETRREKSANGARQWLDSQKKKRGRK